jgi:hypothetical protein
LDCRFFRSGPAALFPGTREKRSGPALFGDLTPMPESDDPVEINRRLESSKIVNGSEYASSAVQPLDKNRKYGIRRGPGML